MFVLINGKKRAGKNYIADLLKIELEKIYGEGSVGIIAFADPIKQILTKTFNISLEQLNKFKSDESEVYVHQEVPPIRAIYGDYEYIKLTDFRKILQNFGTEAMKPIFGDDVWAKLTYEAGKKYKICIVPDFRFKVEAIVKDLAPTITIKILGGEGNDTHISENDLLGYNFDIVVDNTHKGNLSRDVDRIVKEIIKQNEVL